VGVGFDAILIYTLLGCILSLIDIPSDIINQAVNQIVMEPLNYRFARSLCSRIAMINKTEEIEINEKLIKSPKSEDGIISHQ
jgi:hypothetical protein